MKKVAIIGSGVGGLTLANLLSKNPAKYAVKLYERTPELKSGVGAGFSLQAAKTILEKIGYRDQINAAATPMSLVEFSKPDGTILGCANLYEAALKTGFQEPLGFGIMRDDLLKILASGLPQETLQLGKPLSALSQESPDTAMKLQFADGTKDEADIVVGADGIRSTVRQLVFGETAPVYSGNNIWFGTVPRAKLPAELAAHLCQGLRAVHGTGIYCGSYSCGEHIIFWIVTNSKQAKEESWELDGAKQEAMKLVKDFKQQYFTTLITEASRLINFSMYYREPLKGAWSKGRAVILGDAAHATLPYLGMGANQAIEDAYCLASALDKYDIDTAFDKYYKAREPKTTKLVKTATQMGKLELADSQLLIMLRNVLFKFGYSTGMVGKGQVALYRQNLKDIADYEKI